MIVPVAFEPSEQVGDEAKRRGSLAEMTHAVVEKR